MLLRVGIIALFFKYALLTQSFGAKPDTFLSSQETNAFKDSVSLFLFKAEYIVDSLPEISYEYSEKAHQLASKFNFQEQSAFAFYLMGKAKLNLSEYYEARKFLKAALSFYQTKDRAKIISYIQYNLGISEFQLSLFHESIGHFLNAAAIFKQLNLISDYAKALQSLAHINHTAKNYAQADSFYSQAVQVFKRLHDLSNVANIYQSMGMLNADLENDSLAFFYYQKSVSVFKDIHDLKGIGITYSQMGLLYLHSRNPNKAFKHFEKAYAYFVKSNYDTGKMWALNNLGSSKAMNKELVAAEKFYKQSLELAKKLKSTEGMLTNYSDLSKIYEERGQYQSSLVYTKKYTVLKDSFATENTQQKVSKLERLYNTENKEKEIIFNQSLAQKRQLQLWSMSGLLFIMMISILIIVSSFYQKRKAEKKLAAHKLELEKLIESRTKELQQQISERRVAEESDKLKSAFLANMSHELRTPMNAIIAFSNFLREPDLSKDKQNEYLDHITTAGDSLLRLIDDIIDIAKIESQQLKLFIQPTNINRLLTDLYKIFNEIKQKKINKEIQLKLSMDQQFNYIINTDAQRLKQVLTNLIDNAFKYTLKGYIEIGFETKENNVIFIVADTGIGIPKGKHDIIFERFYQLNDIKDIKTSGTGLGLAICKSLIKLLGGYIRVESTLGKGSVFYVNIPVESIKKQPNTTIKPTENREGIISSGYDWSNTTILVAEDEDLNFKVLDTCLSKTKANIVRARDGKAAIEIFKSQKVDLVLMDIQMPILDGYAATKEIKKINNQIPIIAQTSFAMPDEKENCLRAGCDDFITKPLNLKSLLDKIEHYINAPLVNSTRK